MEKLKTAPVVGQKYRNTRVFKINGNLVVVADSIEEAVQLYVQHYNDKHNRDVDERCVHGIESVYTGLFDRPIVSASPTYDILQWEVENKGLAFANLTDEERAELLRMYNKMRPNQCPRLDPNIMP